MDKIPIPERDIVSLDAVAPGLTGLRLLFVNVFAVSEHASGWSLVDGGVYTTATRIRRWADEQFGGAAPESIILTHGHFDHVGALDDLLAHWNVPVFAHPRELPFLTGKAKYPPPDPSVGGGLMSLLSPLYSRGPIDLGDHVAPLPHDGSVPGMPGWHWIATPGHSPGHVSLFREADRTLIAGDAFTTTRQESFLAVASQRPELHGPPPTTRRTKMPRALPWSGWRSWTRTPSRPDTACPSRGPRLPECSRNWRETSTRSHARRTAATCGNRLPEPVDARPLPRGPRYHVT